MLAYELLTQIIILVSKLRARIVWKEWFGVPKGRVCDVYAEQYWNCCDCGLQHFQHFLKPDEKCDHIQPTDYDPGSVVAHIFPNRPKDYDYKFRIGAAESSLAKEK